MLIKQLPITVRASHKSDVRTQFAALCYRIAQDRPQILLVTSRKSGRWILPKGWPVCGLTPAECAGKEAWEEAGVIGKARDQCLGIYSYDKVLDTGDELPCVAMVYPVKVKTLVQDFPEHAQRRRKWFSPKKAASHLTQPELARIVRDFNPKILY